MHERLKNKLYYLSCAVISCLQCEHKEDKLAVPEGEVQEDPGRGADGNPGQPGTRRHDESDEQGAETNAASEIQGQMGEYSGNR